MTHETATGYRPDDVVDWNPDGSRWERGVITEAWDTYLVIKLADNGQKLPVRPQHLRLVTREPRRSVETDGLNLRDGGTPREDAIAGAVNHTSEATVQQATITAAAAHVRALADRYPTDVFPDPPTGYTEGGTAVMIAAHAMRGAFEQAAQAVEGLLTDQGGS